jgi:hypothetical protein
MASDSDAAMQRLAGAMGRKQCLEALKGIGLDYHDADIGELRKLVKVNIGKLLINGK